MPIPSKASRAEWRARREERRAKQRSQNLIRAQQMHQGRLEYEAARERRRHSRSPPLDGARGKALQTFVGCSGWFYWHWRGTFYPESASTGSWFQHYAKQFKTVELNAPFYSWPTTSIVNTWKRRVARRRFKYTVKVNELITHTKHFARTDVLVKDFGLIADLLGPHFGCFLFQLPPSFHYTRARLDRIVRQLDPRHRNVVEFRHKSWWNERVYEAFTASSTIFCSASGPRLPDDLVETASDIYIRFHGTKRWYRHDYTKEELRVWTERVRQSGAKRLWAYFNNDREGYAIKNAREFIRQLRT